MSVNGSCRFIVGILMVVVAQAVMAHGMKSTSVDVQQRPHQLWEMKFQFDITALLNFEKQHYPLQRLVALESQQFERLYAAVIELFDTSVVVRVKGKPLPLHRRYPSAEAVHALLKRQFLETSLLSSPEAVPYTFSDRRFYQVVYIDFKLADVVDMKDLRFSFPAQLGDIALSYSEPKNASLHGGESWTPASLPD